MNRFITGVNILLVILVAIGSFVLSYSALSDLASKNGFADWRAYVLPLVIDVGMLAFGLAVVHAHLHGTNPIRRRGLNLAYIIATTTFNIVHAPNNLLAQTLAALPPVTLFFTFEVLMAMIEHNIKQRQDKAALASHQMALLEAQRGFGELMAQIEAIGQQHKEELAQRDNQLSQLHKQLEIALDPVKARREDILIRLQGDNPPTQKELAEIWGVSTQTIQTDIKALNGKANGNGAN